MRHGSKRAVAASLATEEDQALAAWPVLRLPPSGHVVPGHVSRVLDDFSWTAWTAQS